MFPFEAKIHPSRGPWKKPEKAREWGRAKPRAPLAGLAVFVLAPLTVWSSDGNDEIAQKTPQPDAAQASTDAAGPADTAADTAETKEVPDDLTSLSLEELTSLEIDAVYGAAKHTQKVTEAPAAVTIITADEIQKLGHRSLGEILQNVRGLFVTYDRNYSYAGVRGFNRPGDYNSRVLLLVDGHRINDNIYDQASIGYEFPVDVELIERVEIIRGPGSSLYGSNAFFGVINVITKRGQALNSAETSVRAGSFDAFKSRLSYGKLFKNGLDLLVSSSGYWSDGPTLHFKELDDPATNNGIARRRDGEWLYNLFANASYKDFTLQGVYQYRDKEVPTAAFGTIFDDRAFTTVDERWYLDLKYEGLVAESLNLLARVYYDGYYYRGTYPFDLSGSGGPPRLLNKDVANGALWGSEAKLTTEVIPRNKVTLGAELNHDFQQDQNNFDVAVNLDDKRNTFRLGLYAQDELKIIDSLVLSAGVRYDYYETSQGTINPRLGLIYSPFEKTAIKALFGDAFRAPNAYELHYSDGGTSQKPNPDLDAETIRSYELVVEQYVGNSLRFSASVYHYEINDLISLETDPSDGLLQFRNVDEVQADGLELEAAGKWAKGLQARASYALQHAEDKETDRTLTNSPRHLIKLSLIVPLLAEKVFAGIEGQYTSRRKAVSGNFAEDHFLLNFTIFGANLHEGLDVSASIYNVLDARYGDPGSEEHVQETIEQDGRTFSFQLTYRFW